MGVERMIQNTTLNMHGKQVKATELFANKNIHFSSQGILPSHRVAEWAVNTALEWAESQTKES